MIYADDGDKTYYHFNAHGDVVALTNESGSKTKSYSYNAFGVEHNESTLDDNPFRYCGEYYDKETKTIYLRARYYNAAQGRFTQQDGWEYANPEDPLSLNLYTYCWNNPVRYKDYSGNVPVETILDVVSVGFSLVGFITNPNLATFGDLAWDIGSIVIPYLPGSYVKKGVKALAIATDKVADIVKRIDDAKDIAKRIDIFLENRQYIIGSYKDIKTSLKKLGVNFSELGYEVHHLIEKRFAEKLGIKNADDILSVILDNKTHDKITADFRKIIGYSKDKNCLYTIDNATQK